MEEEEDEIIKCIIEIINLNINDDKKQESKNLINYKVKQKKIQNKIQVS